MTVWDAIGDLPEPGDPRIPNHEYVTVSDRKIKGIASLAGMMPFIGSGGAPQGRLGTS